MNSFSEQHEGSQDLYPPCIAAARNILLGAGILGAYQRSDDDPLDTHRIGCEGLAEFDCPGGSVEVDPGTTGEPIAVFAERLRRICISDVMFRLQGGELVPVPVRGAAGSDGR